MEKNEGNGKSILSEKDIQNLNIRGLSNENINIQIDRFIRGNIPISLVRPAEIDDGIIRFGKERRLELIEKFDLIRNNITISKFIPASGAATRMFGNLISSLEKIRHNILTQEELISSENDQKYFSDFIHALKEHEFPFHDDLSEKVNDGGENLDDLISVNDIKKILEYILEEKGLNYGSLPKGLLKFHKYSDRSVTAIAEHFAEAVLYSKDIKDTVDIHFTISEKYLEIFENEMEEEKKIFDLMGISLRTEFSFQDISTNTLSFNRSGEPVRDEKDEILLRAGGHGSLIKNLEKVSSDLIFIKNIDNITTIDKLRDTIESKKLLGSFLIEIRNKIFNSIKTLPRIIKDGESINEIYCFAKDVLNIPFPVNFIEFDLDKKKIILFEKLNRPVRVCGMVKNMSEPGGGPFWIENNKGEITLQIVEASQINGNSPEQMEIFSGSSYFNPVDIVCSIKNSMGNRFDLENFIEDSRYFISEKEYRNEKIKVIEHPGLWNGGMEKWISLYVEVPLSTFNPVKFLNDLLKENHKPSGNISFSELLLNQ